MPSRRSSTRLSQTRAATATKSLEELEDDEVTERALEALRQMFGQVPQPTRVIVTRWGADEFSYGSYSFVGVGATGADYSTVAEPVGKELYFAGEHTSEEHPATVVGAYLSGLTAARVREILEGVIDYSGSTRSGAAPSPLADFAPGATADAGTASAVDRKSVV